jgi:hypothetical protein
MREWLRLHLRQIPSAHLDQKITNDALAQMGRELTDIVSEVRAIAKQ